MSTLRDRLSRDVVTWRPEPGDVVEGEVLGIEEVSNDFGVHPVITLLAEDESEVVWHCFGTVAMNEVAKRKPQVGDRMAVKYLGVPDGKAYKAWRVLVEHREPKPESVDWQKIEDATQLDAEIQQFDLPDDEEDF